jgi:hypothetical protein
MTFWFQLTEIFPWTDPFPPGAREIPYRIGYLSASLSAPERPDYGPNLIDRSPCDTGPPCLCRDVQSFAIWAEQRRLGPEPGALLALALFGGQPESRLDSAFTAAEWRAAVDGYVAAGATLCLAVVDSPAGLDISVPLTIDIIWFLARGSLLVRWMDLDRGRRLDSTNALPMMPVCLEVCRMATRRVAQDEGLATRVAETLVELLFVAGGDCRDDTPSQRIARAELVKEFTAERAVPPLPL